MTTPKKLDSTEQNKIATITILQCNLNRNRARTHGILNHPDTQQYTILLLQEQYWSPYITSSPMHHSWTLIEPAKATDREGKPRRPRSAIYINNTRLPMTAFAPVPTPLHDITAITINTNNNDKPTLIVNIYNPQDEDLITPMQEYLRTHLRLRKYGNIIIAGDFNLHSPL